MATAKIIGIANQKGGVGKTTTTQNLGAALANKGKKILLIDLDAQGNLTDCCGKGLVFEHVVEMLKTGFKVSIMEKTTLGILAGEPIQGAIQPVDENLDIVPGHMYLASADLQFAATVHRESLLEKALEPVRKKYDAILLDCPPNLGLIAQNAFNAMSHVLVPVQCEYYSLVGLSLIEFCIDMWRKQNLLKPGFKMVGILPTFFDGRKNINVQVREHLMAERKNIVFNTSIRDNVDLAVCPGHSKTIFQLNPKSAGAADYTALAEEVSRRLGWQ